MILTLQKLIQKAKTASDPRDAHALALDLVESMLRHYAVVTIAAYRHVGARDAKVNRILSEQLPRPSMGSWKNFLQVLAHADPHIFPESFWDKFLQPLTKKISNLDIVTAYAGLRKLADQDVFSLHETETAPCTPLEFFDAAVAYRNRFAGHGTHELPDSALTFAPLFLKGAAALCSHLSVLWLAYPVYVAKQAKLYGRTFFRLTPLVEAEGIGELQTAAPGMEDDRLYICFGDKKHPEVESLYPAALWEEDDILFANGTKGLIDIHYIGYASQRSFETSIYEEDFRAFLTPFAQTHISDEQKQAASPAQIVSTQVKQTKGKWKFIMAAMGVILLFITAATGFLKITQKGNQKINSIAVLAFKNNSNDPNQEYLCEGIPRTIITTLTQIDGLNVIAPESAFFFKGTNATIAEIGRKLKVQAVLNGSVQKNGDNLRVIAQLTRVENESNLWGDKYDQKMGDIFAIQDDISEAIVREMKGKISKDEKTVMSKQYTENAKAFNLYLLAINSRNIDTEKRLEYLQEAINIDKNFALAYVAYARYEYNIKRNMIIYEERINNALEIDPNLSEAHDARARIMRNFYRDWAGAEKEYQLAIKLNRGNEEAHRNYANFLRYMKHCDEALKEITLAQDLNPLNIWVYSEAIAINIILERYDDALTWFNKGNIIEQNNFYLHRHLGRLYLKLGKYNDALIAFEKERDFAPDERYKKEGELDLHLTYAYSGEKKIAEKFLQKLIKENEQNKRDSSIPVYIATIYTALGDYTSAIEWLEKAYNVPKIYYSSSITKIYSYFEFDPLRSNPRFQALLKKMHFPEEKSLGK